ncbi:cationic amino acid transporter 2 isoform X2 [Planococcus citri]|uniref:cationic amino acid transporter 2 isoform X2 n=1 Tax=Planococcus citri TaxID=170843 RepID=UPI0031FA33B5
MPSSRHKILSHVFSGICFKLNRTKRLSMDSCELETPLKRCLTTFDITLLGVGHMVGAGIYVLTGTVAKDLAGPGIMLSFVLAGIASTLAALCYAEFGTRVPKAGSAYVYTYVSIGEFWAFIIGWNIVLEHMIGAASVARAWSGYVDSLVNGQISGVTKIIFGDFYEGYFSKHPDLLSFFICILYSTILGLGVKCSALINSCLTGINLAVILVVIAVGFSYGKLDNWSSADAGGFLPFGLSGVISGAATCFYAYVGFDCIATSGEEAQEPCKSIPIATILAMTVVSAIYVLVSAALTLMVPYSQINPNAALPEAFSCVGLHWVSYIVILGAVCGMTTSLLGSLFSLPRCLYAMAEDGLIFKFFANIDKRTQDVDVMYVGGKLKKSFYCLKPLVGNYKPGSAVSTAVFVYIFACGLLCSNVYAFAYTSMDDWFIISYVSVAVVVMILCIIVIEAHEQNTTGLKFKVPLVPYLPALSILCNVELMANLNFLTWIRFILWMALGLLLYFGYGIRNSKLNDSSSPYLVLLSSSEGEKTNWGTISKKKVRSHLSSLYDDDTEPIINDD